MSIANSRATSRSFVDLSLLSCVNQSDSDPDLEPDEMKDVRSFTGVKSPYKIMAASPDGHHILFKKNNKTLYTYNTDDMMRCNDIRICGIDVCHETDTIFDFAFIDERNVVLVLQSTESRLYVAKGILDLEGKLLKIITPVSPTYIAANRKHYMTCVIHDENGPVLISYPISYPSKAQLKINKQEDPTIELLHLHCFYETPGMRKLTIRPTVKDSSALLCDPFIYRNRLYLFNRFESNLLCISISGKDKGEVRILNTYGDPKYQRPNSKYANRCHMVLGDVLLVYFYQRLDNADAEPQLWKLELGSMTWFKLHLLLSCHSPTGRVCIQQVAGQPLAFLHGECGKGSCAEKAHLCQLNLQQECVKASNLTIANAVTSLVDKVNDKVRRSISSVDLHGTTPSTSSNSTQETPQSSPKPSLPPAMRYANRRNNYERAKRSSSISVTSKASVVSLPANLTAQSQKPFMHWGEEMAQEGEVKTLSEQLALAKDMGYTDDEITQAVSMNGLKQGAYQSFSTIDAMVDMLSRVQKMYESSGTSSLSNNNNTGDSGLELDKSSYASSSPPRTPTTGVRRTISFHSVSSPTRKSQEDPMSSSVYDMRYRGNGFQLQRLLDAFDKERRSFSEESTRSIKLLEEKCRQYAEKEEVLKSLLETKEKEIQSLKAQLHDHNSLNDQLKVTKAKLDIQLLEGSNKAEQLRALKEHAEVIKKQHESELREKEKTITELYAKVNAAEEANRPAREKCVKLENEVDELKRLLSRKQAELDKCSNYHDEIRKLEELMEEMRMERDEVRSTLSKVPTCVICLDKRPQMLYMPCSHFICCESCGRRFENCPTCRQKICGKIVVYQ